MDEGIKKHKGGRPRGSRNKGSTALVRLDKAAGVLASQVAKLKADKKRNLPRTHLPTPARARFATGGSGSRQEVKILGRKKPIV